MNAGYILRNARRRAHLSQRRLATLSSIAQPTIARIETGREDPRLSTLVRLLAVCGDELRTVAKRGRGIDRTMIRELLEMTPAEQAELLRQEADFLSTLDQTAKVLRGV